MHISHGNLHPQYTQNGFSSHLFVHLKENDSYFKGFQCFVCLDILNDPVSCLHCGHSLCQSCLYQIPTSKTYYDKVLSTHDPRLKYTRCPMCKTSNFRSQYLPNKQIKRIIDGLHMSCPEVEQGCSWTGTTDQLTMHLQKSCCESLVKCNMPGCEEYIRRKDQVKHSQDECQYRYVRCTHCQAQMMAHTFPAHIRHKCTNLFHSCPNQCFSKLHPDGNRKRKHACISVYYYNKVTGQSSQISKSLPGIISDEIEIHDILNVSQLTQHLNHECPLEKRPCCFSEAGCPVVDTRQRLVAHLGDPQCIASHNWLMEQQQQNQCDDVENSDQESETVSEDISMSSAEHEES